MDLEKREKCILDENTITFGKYKDLSLSQLLRDRKYCSWLLEQDWFSKQYEYLYNRVKEYKPREYFVTKSHYDIKMFSSVKDFLENYEYFYLVPIEELKINLSDNEKTCYNFYLSCIDQLREKVIDNAGNATSIKAPSSWLKKFENKYHLSRDIFKDFINSYDLPNIPFIVEDIKKMGGIEYKGAKSYIIAKDNSLKQEKYWEEILKYFYGEDIGTQYKFKKCFFDFIHINTNTVYECKLNLKDFNEDQYRKYKISLETFSLVYLIDRDCIIDLKQQTIFTTNVNKYLEYFISLVNYNKFDNLIKNFPIIELTDVKEYFSKYLL